MQTVYQPDSMLRAELGLEKLAQTPGDCSAVIKSVKEVLVAGQALEDIRGKQLMG